MWHKGEQLFHCFQFCFYIYLSASQYDTTLFSFTLFTCLILSGNMACRLFSAKSLPEPMLIKHAFKAASRFENLGIFYPRYWPFMRGNSAVTGEFPPQRPVTRSFDVYFHLCLNKQSWDWWFEKPSHPLWRHCNVLVRKFPDLIYIEYLLDKRTAE